MRIVKMFETNCHSFVSLLITILVVACRMSSVDTTEPSPESGNTAAGSTASKPPMIQPQRQASVTAPQLKPVHFDGNGVLQEQINLRLDYISKPKSGGVSVATCYEAMNPSMQLGSITCNSNKSLKVEVQATHTNQICFIHSSTPKVVPVEVLKLAGCTGEASFELFKYSPDVKLEVVPSSLK